MSSSPPLLSSTSEKDVLTTCTAHNISLPEFNDLKTHASAAKAAAYCPYSKFRVGAAILGADGTITTGANVENAAYPVGTCAERVAFGKAVTEKPQAAKFGKPEFGFRAVAVATDISPPASPCGMCRQFIREFCTMNMPIIMFDKDENFAVLTLEQLLPMSFGPDALPPPGAPGT